MLKNSCSGIRPQSYSHSAFLVDEIKINIYKCYNTTVKKNADIKKWAKDINKYFTVEDTQMVNKYLRRCST